MLLPGKGFVGGEAGVRNLLAKQLDESREASSALGDESEKPAGNVRGLGGPSEE